MPWHVTMMLADSAEAVNNKLYILGGGWSITRPLVPSAVALHIKVPWDRANERHLLRLELVDSDGEPYIPDFPGMPAEPLVLETQFEVGRPPGLKQGTTIDLSLAVGVPPLPLEPGKRYEWRLTVSGEHESDWSLAFSVRDNP